MYFMGVEGSLFTFVQSFYTSIYPLCLVTFCYYLSRYVRVHCWIKGSLELCIHFVNCFHGHNPWLFVSKLLLRLSRSSFRACLLASWYMYSLRGFCLMTLGLQLVVIIGMPSWSLIPGTIVDLSTRVGLVVKNKSNVFLF